MRADDYLSERGESENAFAARAGIHQRSLNRALRGNCTLKLAKRIVRASREAPTPSGGTITYDDLAEEIDDGERQSPKDAAA